ncbi:farnesyl pyrophosphate synthase isoform X2 [Ceratina calcarata]|uniref:Farnesyl pyrophosphate synthase n=1 Tax=Ceratina calcarata TaxID=156304 RepID=A0AAJ7RZX9_9HYME|nr:farnesyl pyrophosphate synthase isoform X2 [Ceratina calcarata]
MSSQYVFETRLNMTSITSKNVDVRTMYSVSEDTYVSNKDESRELMAIWPDVVRDLTNTGRHLDIPDVTKWLAKVLQYNVPIGKKIRGLSVIYAYKSLCPHDLTDENLRLARILAWCAELMQAYFLVLDDIQDGSETRRNQPCWYLTNGIGLAATNDAIMLEMCIYQLLRKHFRTNECYLGLIELFLDSTLRTAMGQCLDMLSTNFGKAVNLDLYTMDRYNSIVKYKTCHYTFVLPAMAAMNLAGIKDPEMYRQAETILLEMGHLFQVRDDYLDCYGDPEVTGKIGTDIEAGKCSWLVVVALQRTTREQRKILEECYGIDDKEKVARVKQLYNELGLQNTYAVYEEETYNLLNTHIQQVSRGLPHDFFLKLLDRACRKVGRKD